MWPVVKVLCCYTKELSSNRLSSIYPTYHSDVLLFSASLLLLSSSISMPDSLIDEFISIFNSDRVLTSLIVGVVVFVSLNTSRRTFMNLSTLHGSDLANDFSRIRVYCTIISITRIFVSMACCRITYAQNAFARRIHGYWATNDRITNYTVFCCCCCCCCLSFWRFTFENWGI